MEGPWAPTCDAIPREGVQGYGLDPCDEGEEVSFLCAGFAISSFNVVWTAVVTYRTMGANSLGLKRTRYVSYVLNATFRPSLYLIIVTGDLTASIRARPQSRSLERSQRLHRDRGLA